MNTKPIVYVLSALFFCYFFYDLNNDQMGLRIKIEEHTKHPWKVHDLLHDFEVEDVWALPITINDDHSIELVQNQFEATMEKLVNSGAAGALFRFRLYLGEIFNWDDPRNQAKKFGLKEGSIRARYAIQESLELEDMPNKGFADFEPIYLTENESLLELENATVHAALHLGKVPKANGEFTAQMTVYVKPKGFFSKAYMLIILPFRWYIVYPAMLNTIKKQWEQFLKSSEALHAICF